MAERKRAIQLKFYVTEQERILIEEKMKLLQTEYSNVSEPPFYRLRAI